MVVVIISPIAHALPIYSTKYRAKGMGWAMVAVQLILHLQQLPHPQANVVIIAPIY